MKTAKITNVQASGTFKELFVFELHLENGDAGKIYKKGQDAGVKIGEEITYTLNDKGSIKIQKEQYQGASGGGNSFTKKSNPDVQKAIIRQSSLKASVELCSAFVKVGNSVNTADILRIADTFVAWVNNGETETVAKAEKVVAKIDNTNLPF
tara:strand:+ start:157 stop:612 length:456 start_codon:yes stop_codon:yes gene_type:complete